MAYFKIGNTDFSYLVKGMKVGMEVLLSDKSGRTANGNNTVDIVNRKDKIYITFAPMFEEDMKQLLAAVQPFVVSVSYRNPRTKQIKTITAYIGTPEPEYYTIQDGRVLYKEMSLNFIEM